MSIRETLNQNAGLATAVLALVVIVSLAYVIYFLTTAMNAETPKHEQAYYSADDGATFFADHRDRIPPFQTEDGRTAVKAYVYRCGEDGDLFVGHLERYNEMARTALAASQAGGQAGAGTGEANGGNNGAAAATPPGPTYMNMRPGGNGGQMAAWTGREVKKPGEGEWINTTNIRAVPLQQHRCPDGSKPDQILPPPG